MRYRHRVRFQQNSPVQDSTGQPIEAWSTYRTCSGNVSDVGGGEDDAHHPVEGQIDCKVKIRYPHKARIPRPADRFLHGEGNLLRTINISSVERADGERRELCIYGTEVQDN